MSKRAIRFALASIVYGLAACFALGLVSLQTCGMTPDSVELCSLQPIKMATALGAFGYLLLSILFLRTDLFGKR